MAHVDTGFVEPLGATLGAGLSARVARECRERGLDPATFCAQVIERAVAAAERNRRAEATPPQDAASPARLRRLVAAALAQSSGWETFQAALARRDLKLRPLGPGLELRRRSDDAPLGKASEVGPGYAALIRRFGRGMPGHPQSWLVEQVLGGSRARPDRPSLSDDGDALVVYEE